MNVYIFFCLSVFSIFPPHSTCIIPIIRWKKGIGAGNPCPPFLKKSFHIISESLPGGGWAQWQVLEWARDPWPLPSQSWCFNDRLFLAKTFLGRVMGGPLWGGDPLNLEEEKQPREEAGQRVQGTGKDPQMWACVHALPFCRSLRGLPTCEQCVTFGDGTEAHR